MDIYSLDTPSLLVHEDILQKNIKKMQDILDHTSISLRPHTKTHKSPYIAKLQIDSGSKGITVAKLGEAEVMAENGIDDIFIAYPLIGDKKRKRLVELLKKAKLRVSFDSNKVADYLSSVAEEASSKIGALVEVNTGLDRCGLTRTQDIIDLAKYVTGKKGLSFKGLMAYSGTVYRFDNEADMEKDAARQYGLLLEKKNALLKQKIECEVISTGSTPSVKFEKDFKEITELRPGGYVFNDRNHLALGHCSKSDCAAMIMTTVVSKPEKNRIIIDAGSKAFGADNVVGEHAAGFGLVVENDLVVTKLNEEHGIITADKEIRLNIGDKVKVIPNHICSAVNNFKYFYLINMDKVIRKVEISAQGKIT